MAERRPLGPLIRQTKEEANEGVSLVALSQPSPNAFRDNDINSQESAEEKSLTIKFRYNVGGGISESNNGKKEEVTTTPISENPNLEKTPVKPGDIQQEINSLGSLPT